MQQVPEQWLIKASQVKLAKDKQKPIGTGNFADVYLGTFQRRNKSMLVAVKMSKATITRKGCHTTSTTTTSTVTGDDLTKDEMSLNEMQNEAMIMLLMHHPHVIEFFGVSLEKAAMIIMEYCPGGSLEVHLQAMKEYITNSERVVYLAEICSGMKYLELKKIIHRDLAARNILISSSGQLKIADFGLSRSPNVDSGPTTSAQVPVRWMAPESLKKDGPFTSKSDVWSYGVVGFEIYNYGIKPWPEQPAKWIATRIRQNKMLKPPNRTPRPVREIIAACWKPNPAERPTFQQLSGRIAYIQNIRFAPPPAEKFTLNKAKVVTRIDPVEEEHPDSMFIELDYVSSKCSDKDTETKSKILQRRIMQSQLEEKKAKELDVRSIRDFVPPATVPPAPIATDGKASKSKKRCSVEELNDKEDDAKDDKEPAGGATKETVEEMEPTDR